MQIGGLTTLAFGSILLLAVLGCHLLRAGVVGGKGMFDSLKKRSAQARMEEERFYAKVIEEYENGVVRHGLYAKAIEKSSGNPEKTKALYIQFRVRSLKDESELNKRAEIEQAIGQKNRIKSKSTR